MNPSERLGIDDHGNVCDVLLHISTMLGVPHPDRDTTIDREILDRAHAYVWRMVNDHRQYRQSLSRLSPAPDVLNVSLEWVARDLCYDAWHQPEAVYRSALAQAALLLTPTCADAYVILAEERENKQEYREVRQFYRHAVLASPAAAAPVPAVRPQSISPFDLLPYLRALGGLERMRKLEGLTRSVDEPLAHCCTWNSRPSLPCEIAAWQLNSADDNAFVSLLDRWGISYRLPTWGGEHTTWLYGRALHRFRCHGACHEALGALDRALSQNIQVALQLLGRLPACSKPWPHSRTGHRVVRIVGGSRLVLHG